jgi:hypothetical protein
VSRAEAKAKKARYSLDAALAEKKRLDAAERKKQELEACWTLFFFFVFLLNIFCTKNGDA